MAPPLKSKFKKLIFLVACLLLLTTNCNGAPLRYVRVAIIQDSAYLHLKVNGAFEVIDSLNNKIVFGAQDINATVTAYPEGILLGSNKFKTTKLYIKPLQPEGILIDGRPFRGNVQFIKKPGGRLLVINFIELEDYVKGILFHEVSHYWPMEALKVQAIVSRTYAVYQLEVNSARDYDLTSDIYSQVYGGRTSERYRTNKAVEQTKDKIITYQDKPISAYFHATCAGHTEDASLLWNINSAVLKGVSCDFCRESPHYNWHEVISVSELREKLRISGYKISSIDNIAILGNDNSGRITDLKIVSADKETKIPAKDFRNSVGPNIIRSLKFSVSVVDDDVVFEGTGWGHGAGLCQWGAYFMAKDGASAEKIIKYYYPGVKISTIN